MNDYKQSDMPERIWADMADGSMSVERFWDAEEEVGGIEYIRADVAAAEKRELEQRLELTQSRLDECTRRLSDSSLGGALQISQLLAEVERFRDEWRAYRYEGYVPPEDGSAADYAECAYSDCADDLDRLLALTKPEKP